MMTESALQSQLLLRAPIELPDLRLFRRNVGVARSIRDGAITRFGIKGQPDLYGLWRGGGFVEVELKSKNSRLRPEQAAYAAWCASWGVKHIVLVESSIDDWIASLRLTQPK